MKARIAPVALVILGLTPLLQIGSSIYASFALVAFVYLLVKPRQPILPSGDLILLLLAAIPFVLKSASISFKGYDLREVLLPLREALCFAVLCWGIEKVRGERVDDRSIRWLTLGLIGSLLLVVVCQTILIERGVYFGLPVDWFVRNTGTLERIDAALLYQTRVRPTAFYGEPSYACFVLLSLVMIGLEVPGSVRFRLCILLVGLAAMFLLRSIAGYLAISLYVFVWLFQAKEPFFKGKRPLAVVLGIVGVFLLVVVNSEVSGRFAQVIAGSDLSSTIRIVAPLELLAQTIGEGAIFGVTSLEIERALGFDSLDNAAIRLFVYYGVLAVPSLLVLTKFSRGLRPLLYLALCMNFNGEFYSYDKVVVMAAAVGTYLKFHARAAVGNKVSE